MRIQTPYSWFPDYRSVVNGRRLANAHQVAYLLLMRSGLAGTVRTQSILITTKGKHLPTFPRLIDFGNCR